MTPLEELRLAEAERIQREHLEKQRKVNPDLPDSFDDEDWQSEDDEWRVISYESDCEGYLVVTFKPSLAEVESVEFEQLPGSGLCGDVEEEE